MQKPFTIEPVMIVAEAVEPIFPGQINLCLPHFGQPQIVETKIGGQMWLIMAAKERSRFNDISPLSKAFAPPCVVLWYRMILRKVKGDRAYRFIGHKVFAERRLPETHRQCRVNDLE